MNIKKGGGRYALSVFFASQNEGFYRPNSCKEGVPRRASPTARANPCRVLVFAKPKNKDIHKDAFIFGGRSGTRTLGPLIKSQLLYQLS